jgi:hypothetical protein
MEQILDIVELIKNNPVKNFNRERVCVAHESRQAKGLLSLSEQIY